jgi:hypothetical protein
VVSAPHAGLPALALAPAMPNPVRSATRLRFDLPRGAHVRLDVYDAHGRRVARLLDARLPAGAHAAEWRPRDAAGRALPPGVYLALLEADGARRARRMVVLR